MIIDGLMLFTGTSNGASGGITTSAYADLPTTGTQAASNILDLGVTSGIPSSANGGGARDIGIGDDPAMKLSAIATVGFSAGTTIQLQLQGAIDDGSGGIGTLTTMWTSPAYAAAAVLAGTQLANVDVPRTIPGQGIPRFLKLNFITTSTNSLGKIEAFVAMGLDQQIPASGPTYSGYPAGVNVAN
jgi:hypothetical protein